MELSKTDVKKISKEFRIPEKDILDFLAEEEKLLRISTLKQSFSEQSEAIAKIAIIKEWQYECKNFSDFEELYINVEDNLITEDFYFNWLKSTKNYWEKKEIYSCALKEISLASVKKFVEEWINQAESLEDLREAMSHTNSESDEYKIGLKKIIKIYKN
jgi:hypothetical protein